MDHFFGPPSTGLISWKAHVWYSVVYVHECITECSGYHLFLVYVRAYVFVDCQEWRGQYSNNIRTLFWSWHFWTSFLDMHSTPLHMSFSSPTVCIKRGGINWKFRSLVKLQFCSTSFLLQADNQLTYFSNMNGYDPTKIKYICFILFLLDNVEQPGLTNWSSVAHSSQSIYQPS